MTNRSRFHYLLGQFDTLSNAELRELNTLKDEFANAFDESWDGDHPWADERIKQQHRAILADIVANDRTGGRQVPLRTASPLRWLWLAAAAVAIGAVSIWMLHTHPFSGVQHAASPLSQKTFSGRQYISLEDGTVIYLNDRSTLSYTFHDDMREISLTGEAWFDVAHDATRPFVIHSGPVTTTVLGTAFTIKAFEEQEDVTVSVERGKVKVQATQRQAHEDRAAPVFLVANEQAVIHKQTKQAEVTNTAEAPAPAADWKQDFFILKGITMLEAAMLIEARYHVTVTIENPKLRPCTVNCAFVHNETLEHVALVISRIMGATYEITADGNVRILGGVTCE